MTAAQTPPVTRSEVVPFTAGDGMALNLVHVTGPDRPVRGPVLVAHGAGVRANVFRPPDTPTLVDALVAEGWDVWLENWRASIDLPATTWDLDQAAVFDHPAAVRTVLDATGASTLKAVIHCQGSCTFALAAVAGLLPEVDTIVSNAVSLHPVIPRWSNVKIQRIVPLLARLTDYVDPHWGVTGAPTPLSRALLATVEATHHECSNTVCKMVSFTYGSGHPALWSHENLSAATHRWLSEEFGWVPLSFFLQMGRSVRAGALTPTGHHPELPPDVLSRGPRTDARFALLAGKENLCFLPESQRRTYDYLDRWAPGRHGLHELDGYGHLDVFFGRYAARDVHPLILKELSA